MRTLARRGDVDREVARLMGDWLAGLLARTFAIVVCVFVVAAAIGFAGPTAPLAWAAAGLCWTVADGRAATTRDTRADVGPALSLGAILVQVLVDMRWPYVGDALYVTAHLAVITWYLRASSFPRARALRRHS